MPSATDATMLARYGVRPKTNAGRGRGSYGPVTAPNAPRGPLSPLGPGPFGGGAGVGPRGAAGAGIHGGIAGYTPQMNDAYYRQGLAEGTPGIPPGVLPTNGPGAYGPSSRGGGGGGGGGGGAAGGMNQATLDAMLRALSQGGPTDMNFTPIDLPDYQGTPMAAFSTAPWDTMRSSVAAGAANDQAAATQGYGALSNTLQQNYKNPYANAPVQGTPQVQRSMGAMLGLPPGAGQEGINAENAYSQNSDQAFANLLGVLGAGADQSQASRMAQVGMDANTTARGIDAQAFGMRSTADAQQARGQADWTQANDARTYQDNLMRQQWDRDEAQQNWQGGNETAQYNNNMQNQHRQAQLAPLLELIASGGAAGLDLSAIMAMMGGAPGAPGAMAAQAAMPGPAAPGAAQMPSPMRPPVPPGGTSGPPGQGYMPPPSLLAQPGGWQQPVRPNTYPQQPIPTFMRPGWNQPQRPGG